MNHNYKSLAYDSLEKSDAVYHIFMNYLTFDFNELETEKKVYVAA